MKFGQAKVEAELAALLEEFGLSQTELVTLLDAVAEQVNQLSREDLEPDYWPNVATTLAAMASDRALLIASSFLVTSLLPHLKSKVDTRSIHTVVAGGLMNYRAMLEQS